MIKVLLVDDEELVLKILKSKVPWNEYEMEIVGSEPDGKGALEFIQKNDVDVVFTDIKMPNMDGIEFIEKALLIKPNTEFIVLSSYSDFPLVKNAFRVGASDYILKVDINSPNMLELLHALKTKKFMEPQMVNSIEAYIKDKLKNEMKQIRDYKVVVAIISEIDSPKEELMKETLKKYEKEHNMVWFYSNNNFVIAFIISKSGCKSNAMLKNEVEYILQGRIIGEQYKNCIVSVSDAGCLAEVDKLYNTARKELNNLKFYSGTRNIKTCKSEVCGGGKVVSNTEIKSAIWKALKKLDFPGVRNIFVQLLDEIENNRIEKELVYSKITDVYIYLINHVFDFNLLPATVNNEAEYIKNKISDFGKFVDLRQWILSQIDLIEKRCNYKKNENLMELVKLFIEQNFDTNLTLDEVARHFGISKGYLSRKFSSVIGVSFKEYINIMKNEKAKILLAKTDYKLAEICSEIGFVNVEHFSRVFKKYIGVSPDGYRKSINSMSKGI